MAVKKTIELGIDIKKAQDDIRDIREQFAELKDSIRILRMELEQKEQALEVMQREYEVHIAKQNLNKIYDMVQGVWIEGQR